MLYGRSRRWTIRIFPMVALGMGFILVRGLEAQSGPDRFTYQIKFPAPPGDGFAALATLDERTRIVIDAQACGSELEFSRDLGKAGESSTALLIAKMAWVGTHQPSVTHSSPAVDCTFSRIVGPCEVFPLMKSGECKDAALADFRKNEWDVLRRGGSQPLDSVLKVRSTHCIHGLLKTAVAVDPGDAVLMTFVLDPPCIAGQVNQALGLMHVEGQMGTAKSACHLFGESTGDWDMSVRNLTRLAYLDERYHVLGPGEKKKLHEDLLTAAGGPAEESYPLAGCGNTEESTGSSQERADERGWTDSGGFWEFLKDAGLFLLKILAIIAILYVLAWLAFQFAAGVVALALAPVIIGGGLAALFPFIPETENHLLMINTSKYLKNKFIIADVGPGSESAQPFESDQKKLKEWLLTRMKDFFMRDFIEYNSRPYHRLSISAIFNIADFAGDKELEDGARLVLDFTIAKAAIGSHQGRRFVPFRRTRSAMRESIDINPTKIHNGLFDLVSAGDQQIGLGLYYAGQTQQQPGGLVSFGAPGHALYAATSDYRPDDFIIDLAITKEEPMFQRIKHVTGEIYSSGASYLISAGGTQTALAYSATGAQWLDLAFKPDRRDDMGVAVPTTLFLAKGSAANEEGTRTTLNELIRIDGKRPTRDEFPSYDGNLCVWDGFACGLNLVVPPPLPNQPASGFARNQQLLGAAGPCMTQEPSGSDAEWDFIDSRNCSAYRFAPRFFIAIYRHQCPLISPGCEDNFGFFEIVDARPNESFTQFRTNVVGANPPGFFPANALLPLSGKYRSARGQDIEFRAGDSFGVSAASIESVDGVAQPEFDKWPRAGGSPQLSKRTSTPMSATFDGFVQIWNFRRGKTLDLDFKDGDHPKRLVH